MSFVTAVRLLRLAGAWLTLAALVLSYGWQLLAQSGEAGTRSWLTAALCIQAASPEASSSVPARNQPPRR